MLHSSEEETPIDICAQRRQSMFSCGIYAENSMPVKNIIASKYEMRIIFISFFLNRLNINSVINGVKPFITDITEKIAFDIFSVILSISVRYAGIQKFMEAAEISAKAPTKK